MNYNIRTILIGLITMLCAATATAQTWEKLPLRTTEQRSDGISLGLSASETGGDGTQMTWGISTDPSNANILYASIDVCPPWKSTDAGLTWDLIPNGITTTGGLCLSVKPTNTNILLFAGSAMNPGADRYNTLHKCAILRSTDQGATWTSVNTTARFNREEAHKNNTVFAWNGDTVYALSHLVNSTDTEQTILKSTDSGATWSTFTTISRYAYGINIPYGAANLYAATSYGVVRINLSTGAKTTVLSGNVRKIVTHPSDANIAYFSVRGGSNNGVWKTTNLTNATPTWTRYVSGVNALFSGGTYDCGDIAISPVDPNRLYHNYVRESWSEPNPKYYSSDAAATWTEVSTAPVNNHDVGLLFSSLFPHTALAVSAGVLTADVGSTTVAYSSETFNGGIRRTTDGGVTWKFRNHGLMGFAAAGFDQIASHRHQIGFDLSNADNLSIVSNDFGIVNCSNFTSNATFKQASRPPVFPASGGEQRAFACARKGNTVVVATGKKGTNQTLSTSIDGGLSWFSNNPGSTTVAFSYSLIEFDSNSENLVYAGFRKGTRANNLQDFTWGHPGLAKFVHYMWRRPGYDYLYSYSSSDLKVYRSTDQGATWSSPYTVFYNTTTAGTVAGIVVDPSNENTIYLLTHGSAAQGGVWKYNGSSWVRKTSGLGLDQWGEYSYKTLEIDPNNGNILYVGGFPSGKGAPAGIYKSSDAGETWTNISYNLGNPSTWNLRVNPHDSVLYNNNASGTWRLIDGEDTVAPTIEITHPTAQNFYGTTSASLDISGNADDAVGLDYVNYSMAGDTTGAGTATGTTAWSISSLGINLGTTTVTIKAVDTAGNETTDAIIINRSATPPPSPVPDLLFPHTASGITVDGALNEAIWATASANDIGRVIDGTKSGTGTAKGLWDINYLYIAIECTDASKNNDTGTSSPHQDTSGEVYVDYLNNNGAYGLDDIHYVLPWNQGDFIWESSNKTSGVLCSVATTGGGYIIEMAIPWSLTGVQGTNSTHLGIDFQQNFDTNGGNRDGATSMYNWENTNYLNTNNFGLAILGTVTATEEDPPSSPPISPISSCALHLKLDETSGTSLKDSSGNNRHGTATGAIPGTTTYRIGKAWFFDGTDDSIKTVLVGSPTTYSLSGWGYLQGTDTNGSTMFSLGDYAGLSHHISGTSSKGFYYDGTTWRHAGTTTPQTNTWHHYVFSVDDSANEQKLYIDGALAHQVGYTDNTNWTGQGVNACIGIHGNGETNSDWRGWIDDIRAYTKVLSPQEVLDLYTVPVVAGNGTASAITSMSATINATASTNGSSACNLLVRYGTQSGIYTGTSSVEVGLTGSTTSSGASFDLTSLPSSTQVYYVARIYNSAHAVDGVEQSFTTLSEDITSPTVQIIYPTDAATTTANDVNPLLIYGSASDAVGLSQVQWLNVEMGTSGVCAGTSEWQTNSFPTQEGTNTCKITAFDTSNNQGTATLTIIRNLDTPTVLISDPVSNTTLYDGTPVVGTSGATISFSGTAVDTYNGVGTVSTTLAGSTTVQVATGTSTFTVTQNILPGVLNTISFLATDTPMQNQGMTTVLVGPVPVPVTGEALSVTRNSALLIGTVTINDAGTTAVSFDYGTTEGVYVGSSSTQTISGTSVTDGLVFWAKLDETSGNAVDITSGNVGTRAGALQNQAGVINKAYYFDGVDDFVNFGDPDDERYDFGTGSFSYGLWVNVATDTTNFDFPIGKGGWGIPPGGYNMELGSGEWYARISNGSDYKSVTFQASPTYNDWKLLYVVVDRIGGAMKGFVNNQQNGTTSLTGWLPGSSTSNSIPLTIVSESGTNYFFRGKVDDVRMYNRALSNAEVLTIYNEGISGRQASVNIPLGSLNKTTQYYYRLSSTGDYETTYGEEEGFITLDGIVTNGQFARTELWPPYSTRFIKFLKDNALWPIPFKQRIRSTQQHLDLQNNPDDELSELLD